MFRILFRLYLVTIISYSAAIYLVPDLVIKVFHERFLTYNLDYSRGLQTLMVRQFHNVPSEQWPALAAQMDKEFEPLRIELPAAIAGLEGECLSANHGARTQLDPVLALAPYEAFAIACAA